jgi:JAB domain-containing protein similar to deubiquitination enzymes
VTAPTAGTPHLQQVLPTARAILWRPVPAGAARGPAGSYPIFIEQKAIAALHDHAGAAKGQALLGFLVGDLYVCPTTKIRYAVIDSTIRLNQAIYGDKTLVVVSRLWDRIQEELRRIHGHLIGWYHSHPTTPARLSAGDVETHEQYFTQPWQAALVLGSDGGASVAGLFRPGASATWASESLQFYELIEGDERLAGGRKRSVQPWSNFTTDDPAAVREVSIATTRAAGPGDRSTIEVVGAHEEEARAPRPSAPIPKPPPPPPPPRKSAPAPPGATKGLPLLDTAAARPSEPVFTPAEPVAPPPPAPPRPTPPPPAPPPPPPRPSTARRSSRRSNPSVGKMFVMQEPRPRRGGLVALLLLVAVGAAAWYFFLGPGIPTRLRWLRAAGIGGGSGQGAPVSAPAADSSVRMLDRLGDSLARAVSRYRDRARLFDNRQLDCAALGPGLVTVEDLVIAYSRGKARTSMLDSTRVTRDQMLAAGADSVERHFDRSTCPRP